MHCSVPRFTSSNGEVSSGAALPQASPAQHQHRTQRGRINQLHQQHPRQNLLSRRPLHHPGIHPRRQWHTDRHAGHPMAAPPTSTTTPPTTSAASSPSPTAPAERQRPTPTTPTATPPPPPAAPSPHRPTTGATAAATPTPNGTIKLGARYYAPLPGRFTQPDPSGQEANRYLYAGDDPIGKSDPGGLYPCVAQSDPSQYDNPNNYDGCITDIGSTTNVIGNGLSDLGKGAYNAGSIIAGCAGGMAAYDSSGIGALLSIVPVLGEFSNAFACAAGADVNYNNGQF